MLDKLYQISIYLRSNRIACSIIFDNTMLMVRLGLVQKRRVGKRSCFGLKSCWVATNTTSQPLIKNTGFGCSMAGNCPEVSLISSLQLLKRRLRLWSLAWQPSCPALRGIFQQIQSHFDLCSFLQQILQVRLSADET